MSGRVGRRRVLWGGIACAGFACLALPGVATANTFPGTTGFGLIPDGTSTTPGSFNAPLNIGIPVSGFVVGSTPKKIAVTVALQHRRVGDLEIKLIAPGGQQKILLGRTGAQTAGSLVGSTANLDGTYTFSDSAPSSPTWWQMAAATPDTRAIPIGNYRASDAGPDGGSNATILSAPLTGVTDMNGTWTLSVRDGTAGDGTGALDPRGQVNSASLELVGTRQADAGSLGAIPDAPVGSPAGSFSNDPALQRNVTFPITGLAAAAPSAITVSMLFEPDHTWVGDLDVRLIAPDGTQGLLFTQTGATPSAPSGDGSNLDGPYQFLDVVGAFNWWTKAGEVDDNTPLISSGYHAATANGADTSLVGLFSGVSNPNGTWTLRFRDGNDGDVGGVSAASLDVRTGTDSAAPSPPSFTGTVPSSPSNSNQPKVKGTAEAGSFVRLYVGDPFCSSEALLAATGTAGTFGSTGIELPALPSNTDTSIYASAYDASGNVSGCTPTPLTYTEDSTAPATPTITGTDPPSPANNNFPKLKGSGAEVGSKLTLYNGPDCAGPVLLNNLSAAEFNGAGVVIESADDDSNVLRVTATDTAGNASGCSNGVTYTEDSTAPAPPALSGTDPPSGTNENFPKLKGAAEPGAAVTVFTSSDCSGAPAASGTASDLTGGGIGVSVADNSTTSFSATATDSAGNISGCSGAISYAEVTQTPNPPPEIPGPGPDLLAPQTTITSAPKATVKTKGKSAPFSISFSANEPATFKCSLDKAPFAPCSSPATGKAKKGSHTFSVVATDSAGNVDPSPATAEWKVKRKKRHH